MRFWKLKGIILIIYGQLWKYLILFVIIKIKKV
ncbi:BnaC06g01560D [Brassica napus]|uniref:BnaC06g01560D protein n=1 Tax=Brassica napus TaxID=3708 RepID=A0A078G650_BRANA|nr:BnaC06g01560D [Brassica napus]